MLHDNGLEPHPAHACWPINVTARLSQYAVANGHGLPQWGIGMMAIFVGLTSIVGVVYQIQSPWELQHFATLRPLVSSFELVVGLLPLTFSAILNGASIVCTSSSQNALLVLAVAIGCAGGLGWAIVFIWNGFFSWMHLWLPLLPPIYPGLAYLLITEVYASREELRRVEKLVFEHESA